MTEKDPEYPTQDPAYPPLPGYPGPPQQSAPPQEGDPPQQGYPPQQVYPPQQSYPGPPQQGYPPQQAYPGPPQQGYPGPPQQGYPGPPQQSYPPQQGYPPQEGYPPQQGYLPQEGYPTKEGYLPQGYQPGYPAQQQAPPAYPDTGGGVTVQYQPNAPHQTVIVRTGQLLSEPPNNYLFFSIFVTVCCCWVFGLCGILNASKVNRKWVAGDVDGAQRAAMSAKNWSVAGLFTGIAMLILVVIVEISEYFKYGY
ncbi:uncharacterized protein [Amphiura filiformis]|uniref:uncharacterized protein isoform X2 n=1 Tax=Amphiura filiformis TaxID=82378 RepID=UPI003B223B64